MFYQSKKKKSTSFYTFLWERKISELKLSNWKDIPFANLVKILMKNRQLIHFIKPKKKKKKTHT